MQSLRIYFRPQEWPLRYGGGAVIRYSNAKKALFTGTFFSLILSVAAASLCARFLCDFDLYLDCYYSRVFLAEAAVFFPFCFLFFYLIFLLVFSSAILPFDHSDPAKMLNRVLFSVWLFLVFSLAGFFFLIPAGNAVKEQAAFRSSVAADSLNKMTEAFRAGRYREALNFLSIYESVDDHTDARFSSADENISFAFVRRRSRDFPHREFWLNSENIRSELESRIAGQTVLPVRTTENDYALKKLAYEKYSFGRENGYYRPVAEAYKIFRYLSVTAPDDGEIGLHMKRAETEIRRHVLVKDRIREESIFPLSHNICFVNVDNEEVRQIISARKLISLTGRNLVESVRVETICKDGRKSVLEAEYGKVESDRILFDSVFLAEPTTVTGGRFSEGEADEWVNGHYVPLGLAGNLLPLFDSENRNLSTVPFFDLIRIRDRLPEETEISGIYAKEIVIRLIRLFLIVLAPFFMLECGFLMAPKEKKENSGTEYLFIPVVPAVCLLFYAAYRVANLAAAAGMLFFSFETLFIVLPLLAAGALVLLVGLFVISYSRRMI